MISSLFRVAMSGGWLTTAGISGFYTSFCWMWWLSDSMASSIWIDRHADQLFVSGVAVGISCGLLGAIRRWARARWGLADVLAGTPMIAFVLTLIVFAVRPNQ